MTNISEAELINMFQNFRLYLSQMRRLAQDADYLTFTYCIVVIFSYVTSNPQHFQRKDSALAYVPKHVYFRCDTAVYFHSL